MQYDEQGMPMLITTKYIYDYRPGGKLAGNQVRFKRREGRRTETTSEYFSIARYGTIEAAYFGAVTWRDYGLRWIWDRAFRPKYINQRKHDGEGHRE